MRTVLTSYAVSAYRANARAFASRILQAPLSARSPQVRCVVVIPVPITRTPGVLDERLRARWRAAPFRPPRQSARDSLQSAHSFPAIPNVADDLSGGSV
jgi:hypothetical protein